MTWKKGKRGDKKTEKRRKGTREEGESERGNGKMEKAKLQKGKTGKKENGKKGQMNTYNAARAARFRRRAGIGARN